MTANQVQQNLTDHAERASVSELPVSTFMDVSPVALSAQTTIAEAVQTFSSERVSGAPIIDGMNKLLGMVSESDLLLLAATKDLGSPIVFKTEIIGLKPEDTLKEALVLLYKNRLRRLPVVDAHGILLGVVTRIDILNRLVGNVPTPE